MPRLLSAHSNATRAGATPKATMSDRESYSAPKALCVLVRRATRPSSPSRTMATKMAMAALENCPLMALMIAYRPVKSAAVVNRFGSR
ncbi:hypothetical protein D3C78_1679790 [compost metagenome]